MWPEEIAVTAAYLRDGVVSAGQINPSELSLARGAVESGHRELTKAVPREPLSQHPADFPCTSGPWARRWCNYRELWGRDVGRSSP
jgi:hypothetical protein